MRTTAARRYRPFIASVGLDGAKRAVQQRGNPRVDQVIVNVQPIFLVIDHVCLAQDAQLLGDVGLRAVEYSLQMANAFWISPQNIQNLQAHRVAQ